MPANKSQIYQLKITLLGSKPPIWRRVQLRGDMTLYKLHQVIQRAMGWFDGHLHEFEVGEERYGVPDPDWGDEVKSERRVRLGQIVSQPKDRFRYTYDFGDDWDHEIVVEKILEPEPGVHYPRCLTGRRACPPEDVGGLWGYQDFIEIMADPTHPDHESMMEWIGGPFDPAAFDLEEVNEALKEVR